MREGGYSAAILPCGLTLQRQGGPEGPSKMSDRTGPQFWKAYQHRVGSFATSPTVFNP
jgi:hypothetical protein